VRVIVELVATGDEMEPFHLAVYFGRKDIVQLFVEKIPNFDVNRPRNDGGTALHDSAFNGNFEVVRSNFHITQNNKQKSLFSSNFADESAAGTWRLSIIDCKNDRVWTHTTSCSRIRKGSKSG
jgi:hypothetical protein